MKKILQVIIIIAGCFFAIGIFKDLAIKSIVCVAATQITGAKTEIRGLSLGVFRHSLRISGLRVYNPKGFSKNVLVDLPNVSVDYNLPSLLKGKPYLVRLDIELQEVVIERNTEGRLNVDSLKITQGGPKDRQKKNPSKPLDLQIDTLNLQMGRIVYKDYSAGREPAVQVYDINLNKSYKDITSAQQLAGLIITEPMKQAGIKGAKIYGISILSGAAMLPVAAAITFAGRDSVQQDFDAIESDLYNAAFEVLKRSGKVAREDKQAGIISASVNGADVTVKLKKVSERKTRIAISARKYMLPRPEVASGILYQISGKIK